MIATVTKTHSTVWNWHIAYSVNGVELASQCYSSKRRALANVETVRRVGNNPERYRHDPDESEGASWGYGWDLTCNGYVMLLGKAYTTYAEMVAAMESFRSGVATGVEVVCDC